MKDDILPESLNFWDIKPFNSNNNMKLTFRIEYRTAWGEELG